MWIISSCLHVNDTLVCDYSDSYDEIDILESVVLAAVRYMRPADSSQYLEGRQENGKWCDNFVKLFGFG